jgi:hypothetical protein
MVALSPASCTRRCGPPIRHAARYRASVMAFTVASELCALAADAGVLVAARRWPRAEGGGVLTARRG